MAFIKKSYYGEECICLFMKRFLGEGRNESYFRRINNPLGRAQTPDAFFVIFVGKESNLCKKDLQGD